jgi:hypothetical protein
MSQEKQYQLSVRVEIREPRLGGSGLAIQEDANITCATFLEVAKILGMFHDLTEAVKKGV